MRKSPRDHAQALLSKANNDLVAAEAILATGRAFDAVCFHAQQAVEKSLKAILALYDVEYPWRHDLAELITLVRPLTSTLRDLENSIIEMTPFAVEVRYDAEFEPSQSEAEKALRVAQEVYQRAQETLQGTMEKE